MKTKERYELVRYANGKKARRYVRRLWAPCANDGKGGYCYYTRGDEPVKLIRHSCEKNAVAVEGRGWVCQVCRRQITGD